MEDAGEVSSTSSHEAPVEMNGSVSQTPSSEDAKDLSDAQKVTMSHAEDSAPQTPETKQTPPAMQESLTQATEITSTSQITDTSSTGTASPLAEVTSTAQEREETITLEKTEVTQTTEVTSTTEVTITPQKPEVFVTSEETSPPQMSEGNPRLTEVTTTTQQATRSITTQPRAASVTPDSAVLDEPAVEASSSLAGETEAPSRVDVKSCDIISQEPQEKPSESHQPAPSYEPAPASAPESKPASAPESTPASAPESTPASAPESAPASALESTPASAPDSSPDFTLDSAPASFQPQFPSLLELLYWRDVKTTGVVFGSSLFVLLSLTTCSIISVLSYVALALLSVTVSFRTYKGVLQAVQKSDDGHPFKQYLDTDIALTKELLQKYSDVALGRINSGIIELRRLFLVEDLVDSLKFAVFLWILTCVGALFNGLTLLILGLIGAFSCPIIYEKHQTQIDQHISMLNSQIKDILGKIQANVPGLKRKSE